MLSLAMTPSMVSAATKVRTAKAATSVAVTARRSTDRQRATEALERAEALVAGKLAPAGRSVQGQGTVQAGRSDAAPDATLVMRDLFAVLGDLNPAQRKVAQGILARPTDGPKDPYGYGYTVPALKKCNSHFCIHWVASTADAPPSQTWVNHMLNLMGKVRRKEVDRLGYRPPVEDGGRGGNSKFDVYLKQLGDQGLYGFCAPERRKPGFKSLASAFCVLDNDFSTAEFPLPPMQSAEVTAAHEFFHAIQFGYDYGEDRWLMEATAVWMEEQAYDDVNDNRQYLPAGQVADSLTPLDTFDYLGSEQYGNWPFFELMSNSYGRSMVKQIWNKAAAFPGAPNMYSTQAISAVLKPRGGFTRFYSRFASANLLPAKFYPEGRAWPSTALINTYALTKDDRSTGKHGIKLLHMSSASWEVKPSASLKRPKWWLNIKVDGPPSYRMPSAYVLVAKTHGLDRHLVKLNNKGNGKIKVPFGQSTVKAIYVTLVNASTRFRCDRQSSYSCAGLPIDDGRSFRGQPYKFSASVFTRR
jgi:hypothetical protein